MLFRRELTNTHSTRFCYFYFFLSTFYFSTPSSSTSSLPLPLRRGRILQMFGGWKAKQYNCPSLKRDEQRFALRKELTDTHGTRFYYFCFFLSTFCFSTPSSSTLSLPLPLRRGRIFAQVSAEDKFTCTMPNATENQRS